MTDLALQAPASPEVKLIESGPRPQAKKKEAVTTSLTVSINYLSWPKAPGTQRYSHRQDILRVCRSSPHNWFKAYSLDCAALSAPCLPR